MVTSTHTNTQTNTNTTTIHTTNFDTNTYHTTTNYDSHPRARRKAPGSSQIMASYSTVYQLYEQFALLDRDQAGSNYIILNQRS